ncbi:MAG TPA: DUF2339 domain-containing protein [Steroidobacteraceae bacterium]
MPIVLALVGALLGMALASDASTALGAALGGACGYLLERIMRLTRRVEALEGAERTTRVQTSAQATAGPAPQAVAATTTAREPAAPRPVPIATPRPLTPARIGPVEQTGDRLEAAWRFVRHWLTTGNVPVKVGVIVSFFGVGFLLKYAVDHRLFAFPIELRLLSISGIALALLAVGWRLRLRARVYALSLQGGGLGILYLTTFAAFRLYELVPAGFAFGLLIALTIGVGALAVLQNARGLAALGAIGGFLAPILVSTGAGDHVVLFSYYLVLNALILGVAWYRPWRELNLIGFLFTFVIGGIWAAESYEPAKYASTQPFVVLFFLFYQGVAILFAQRTALAMRGVVDGTLVFATPVLVFAMQALMLRDTEFGLAYSALIAAAFYAITATLLNRGRSPILRLLIEAYLALAVAFATLAIPLALDARWTAVGWALEGAALVWIGRRQDRALARGAGAALIVASALAFMDHGWRELEGPPVLNGNLLGGLLISFAALFSARQLERATGRWQSVETIGARLLVLLGVAWWLGSGGLEIEERLASGMERPALIAFIALSASLMTLVARRLDWRDGRLATFISLPLLLLLVVSYPLTGGHPGGDWGWLGWLLAIAAQFWMLRQHSSRLPALTEVAHAAALTLAALVLVLEVHWQVGRVAPGHVWSGSVASWVPGLMLLAVFHFKGRQIWPVTEFAQVYTRWGCLALITIQGSLVAWLNLRSSGDPTPLPYLPVLNPVDLSTAVALLIVWFWLRERGQPGQRALALVGGIAFLASTIAVLRAVHHLGDVPWRADTMLHSVLVQAALSVYWGLLAFGAMVLGARRALRWLWMLGAALMGVVVAKLFLVELGNTGTVARIVSFIAIGGLLLVVGYLAPAPPRHQGTADAKV